MRRPECETETADPTRRDARCGEPAVGCLTQVARARAGCPVASRPRHHQHQTEQAKTPERKYWCDPGRRKVSTTAHQEA